MSAAGAGAGDRHATRDAAGGHRVSAIALDRLLQSQGFGTRRQCRALVAAGHVCVGGETVLDAQRPFDTAALQFTVRGEAWTYRERVYVALNKPPGHECSRRPSHHPSVLELLPQPLRERGVQPVGRLDHDTTGLLLLSDDGGFVHAQSSPRRKVPKRYLATTHDAVDAQLVARLLAGVCLRDEPQPLAALACEAVGTHRIMIAVDQGKYHQVKRMLAAAGHHCVALQRVAIGGLCLRSLALEQGAWCYLGESERALLGGAVAAGALSPGPAGTQA